MSTERVNRLKKSVTIPETYIPLSLLFDIREYVANRRDEIKHDVNILKAAWNSEYVDRQPIAVKKGIESAIDNANYELSHWYILFDLLNDISHDALKQ
jgi:hypothetical protein